MPVLILLHFTSQVLAPSPKLPFTTCLRSSTHRYLQHYTIEYRQPRLSAYIIHSPSCVTPRICVNFPPHHRLQWAATSTTWRPVSPASHDHRCALFQAAPLPPPHNCLLSVSPIAHTDSMTVKKGYGTTVSRRTPRRGAPKNNLAPSFPKRQLFIIGT
jgi:hypothetical protein